MIDLNEIKETSLQIAELRGQDTDVRATLKYCAGEVLESYEAYGNWTFNNPKGKEDFALELADVIMCILTISAAEKIDIEEALRICLKKNKARVTE